MWQDPSTRRRILARRLAVCCCRVCCTGIDTLVQDPTREDGVTELGERSEAKDRGGLGPQAT